MIVFAADGWMASGITLAWPMVLFLSLGSRYDALGLANAGAGVAGALAGLYSGALVDRGGRKKSAMWVSLALALGIGLRSAGDWSPLAAAAANATGAAVMGFYVPMLMSLMYAGAKRSEGAYAFHFAAEAGWDLGAAGGCLIAAAVAATGAGASLTVIPSGIAVVILYRTLRASALPSPQGREA
jgi:MFS family permease